MTILYTPTGGLKEIRNRAQEFAAKSIAAKKDLAMSTEFPWDLWKALGATGLKGIGIQKEYEGMGLGYAGISAVGKALAQYGYCLGLTLSWLIHEITARFFISEHASPTQKQLYLPAMARGSITASIAISEPGVGGHPKHLKTSAERSSSGYVLNGEKTFLTNGPIADIFIVLAVSGLENRKKKYSAFIVPRDSVGLSLTDSMDFGFLRPCPHGGIVMHGCMVSEEELMGTPGEAYSAMALPFRVVEDALMMGPILGAQEARFHEIRNTLKERGPVIDEEFLFRLGGFSAILSVLDMISIRAAELLDKGTGHGEINTLILAFRNLCAVLHKEISDITKLADTTPSGIYMSLTHDMDHVVRFAAKVNRIKQIKMGAGLMSSDGTILFDE